MRATRSAAGRWRAAARRATLRRAASRLSPLDGRCVREKGMNDRAAAAGMRSAYRHFLAIPTRWMDNDVYHHVNNVVYYSYFDTVINRYLIDAGGLDIEASPV